MFRRLLNFATHRIYNLPVVVMMPHSSCNCRCIMCDIWKANQNKKEIPVEVLEKHLAPFRKLGVREVVLSGGEALLHSNLWRMCALLKSQNIKITLLSTGLLIKKFASEIVTHIDHVIVSIDGSEEVHDRIRNVPNAFRKVSEGIRELRLRVSNFPITARCVLQHHNFHDFVNIVRAAKDMGIDQISFLPADVSSSAFNRMSEPGDVHDIVLGKDEAIAFQKIITESFDLLREEYESKFITESPAKMLKLVQYYKAINDLGEFPEVVCNAPWVSAVLETDGSVMPCFFHKPFGNIYESDFMQIINSKKAVEWRRNLDMTNDPVCRKCVCTLKLRLTQMS